MRLTPAFLVRAVSYECKKLWNRPKVEPWTGTLKADKNIVCLQVRRAGLGRAGWGRAELGRAELGRVELGRAELGRAGLGWAIFNYDILG